MAMYEPLTGGCENGAGIGAAHRFSETIQSSRGGGPAYQLDQRTLLCWGDHTWTCGQAFETQANRWVI
jgi:hypothetical protein